MSWAEQKRKIDQWRQDVAYSADRIVLSTRDRSFRSGVPAPEVFVDDGQSTQSVARPRSVKEYRLNVEEPTVVRRRTMVRRPSSDHGGYSRRRSSTAKSPVRTIVETTAPIRRSSLHHRSIVREEPTPSRSSRAHTRPPPSSLLNTFLPSTRSNRSRTATYERPEKSSYERFNYEKPRARALSPRYSTSRDPEPEVVRYKPRPRSVYSSQPQPVVTSRKSARSGSVDISDRMRLLAVRDRFRDEVDRARERRSSRAQREYDEYRDYDRRSLR